MTNTPTTRSCPVCLGTEFAEWRFKLCRCRRCELVLDASIWKPAANEQLNESFFGNEYEPVQSFWVKGFEAWNNRRTMRRLRAFVDTASDGAARLLEVGVGSGSFLAYAKARGYSPMGCDLSPAICRRVSRTTGIPMHCGSIDSLPREKSFDVIVLNHVLEHVAAPIEFLRDIRTRLAPGGIIHIAVPNVDAWEAALGGWNSYEPYHLIYFTPRTLRQTLQHAGFDVRHVNTHESFSGWFLAIFRSIFRKRYAHSNSSSRAGHRPARMVEHCYRLLMVVWGILTFPLRRLQAFFGKGDEAIAIGVPKNV